MPAVNAKKPTPAAHEPGTRPRQPPPDIPKLAANDVAPLYEKVKRHMSEAILVGEWQPGMLLPNETVLAQSFGVAVGTVRRAMSDLVAEGLLARRRKTGTFVTGRSPHHSLRFFFRFFRLHGADGSLVRSRAEMLSVGLAPATPAEAEGLQLAPGAEVVRMHRIRHAEGRPVMHDRFVLPAARIPGWPLEPSAVPELIYMHLVERYGIRISAVREQITADLANEEDIALLDLGKPEAVLIINEIAYDQAGTPTILGSHRATTRAHVYVNEVQ